MQKEAVEAQSKRVQYKSDTESLRRKSIMQFSLPKLLKHCENKHIPLTFFGIKPYDWEWAQQAVYAHRPRVVSKLVILLEYGWTEPSRTDVSLETHISPLLPFL